MSDDKNTNGAAGETPPRPKRPLSDAQRAALARGQEALAARRAERKAGLVQTSSAEIREAQQHAEPAPIRTLDDVVARHAPEPAPVAPPAPLPSVEQAARETKLYTVGADPLPPPENNPFLNDGVVASSDAPAPDLVGVQPPRNLAGLMEMCPTIGDGQYHIEVVRRQPQQYGGIVCKGIQRPIKEYMTDTDFVSFYGGGEYTLTLYGPPPRGGMIDARTGRPRSKALSPPVKLEISSSVHPPNVQAAVLLDDEMHATEGEDQMRYYQPGFQTGMPARPVTTADARMLEVQLTHEEKMEARREAKEKELREQQTGISASLGPVLDVMRQNSQESMKAVERTAEARARIAEQAAERAEAERLRAQAQAEEARREARLEAERQRNRPTETSEMFEGLTKMAAVFKPTDNGAAIEARAAEKALDQSRQEINRLVTSHAEEMTRVQKDHTDTIRRMQEDHRAEIERRQNQERNETERLQRQHTEELKRQEERLKDNLERAERRAEEAERKADQRVTEAESRVERRMSEMRDEHKRVVDDLRTQNQQRLDDERRQHDRDLKTQAATYETRLSGQKDMYDNRMTMAAQEVTRVTAEADRYRKEASDNKDLGKQIEKIQETASVLGWGPAGADADQPPPPKDWKEMLGRAGMELVTKLPEIVQSAGDQVAKLRGQPGPTPEQVQAMQYDQMLRASHQTMMARTMAGAPTNIPPPMRTASGAVFQPTPLRFGTEDSSGPLDPSAPSPRGYDQFDMQQSMAPAYQPPPPPPPGYPQQTYQPAPPPPQYQAPPAPYQPPPQQYQAPPGAPQTYQPAAPQPGAAPPQQTYQPAQAPQQAAVAAPAAQQIQAPPGSVPAVIPTEMIVQFAPVLEQALASGAPIEEIAQELAGLLGPANLAQVVNGLKPERVVVELQKAGKGSSPLVRRQGQQFLRDLWAQCGALLQQG